MPNLDDAKKDVAAFQALLDKTPAELAHVRLAPGAWTLTEIIGHLIDSASNNHQRFTRLTFGNLEHFPGYEAEPWVEAQQYDSCDFSQLATLWQTYNAFLLHTVATTPPAALRNAWITRDGPLDLGFLITDYYSHMRIHIDQYRERLAEVTAHNAGS